MALHSILSQVGERELAVGEGTGAHAADADLFAFQVLHTGDAGILAYDNWATNP